MTDQHCYSTETLLDLTLGKLPEDEAFRVREHLITCDRCRRRMQELLDVPDEPAPGDMPLTESNLEDAWQRFAQSVPEVADQPQVTATAAPVSASSEVGDLSEGEVIPFSSRRKHGEHAEGASIGRGSGPMNSASRMALAAGLALASFGIWNLVDPTGRAPDLDEPAVVYGVRTLGERGSPTRSSRPDQPTQTECAGPEHTMIWNLQVPRVLEIEPPMVSKVELWSDGRLVSELGQQPAQGGVLQLIVPPELAPDGLYIVKVFLPGDESTEDFYFDVQCER